MTNKTLAIGGAGALVMGLFTPIITLPMMGSVNLFGNGGNWTALALLAFGILAAAAALKERVGDALWPGIGTALLLAAHFVDLQLRLAHIRNEMQASLKDNPFAGLAQGAMGAVQLQWGWVVVAAGAGLIIYAALRARRESEVPLFGIGDNPGRAVAAISALLLAGPLAWNWFNRPPATRTSEMPQASSPAVSSGVAAGDRELSAEKAAYIRDNLKLYDLKARYFDSMLDGRVPGVEFKIKNSGTRTLNEVTVRVVFQDKDGNPIAEEEYYPVLVTEMSFSGNNKPLRPNYIWQNEPGKFYGAKAVPSEWSEGKAVATITDIVFEPAK